ncbi:hypothetical protein BURPS668_A2760 [Burkholderia pseudomallei 668]|uniref:hypothetical protein n=1 Tax=Burkholderia pseudomallei TaxID=28450 RepID=UPI0000F29021|nr:hypothetical protein [Burkholderia pseudomallei]ABN85403.1 hypothetical protein BURPS668_A2760 [Burkholderia pseudomallei 668]
MASAADTFGGGATNAANAANATNAINAINATNATNATNAINAARCDRPPRRTHPSTVNSQQSTTDFRSSAHSVRATPVRT